MKRTILLLSAIIVLAFPIATQADWVDDWMGNITANYTGPSYFEGQKRGYASFGTFSARQMMTRDRLVTFTPPRVRFGCGGIDIFTGGFSYLDMDYLVQKFQNIISAAPAFAFEYALREISEEAASIMDGLESIGNLLNQIQLDDCKAARTLGVYLVDQAAGKPDALGKAMARFKQDTGVDDLWKHIQDDFMSRATPGETTAQENQEINQDCPQEFNELVQSGSLIKFVYDQYLNTFDSSLEDLLRGYLGDVIFEFVDGHLYVHTLSSCGGPNWDSFVAFVDGTAQVNPDDTGLQGINACQPFGGTRIRDLVETALQNAYAAMATNQNLNPTDVALIKMIPVPVYEHIKQCYVYDVPAGVIQMLVDPAAYGVGYALLTNVYSEVIKALQFIRENRVKLCKSQMGGKKHCFLCDTDDSTDLALKDFADQVYQRLQEANQKWTEVQGSLNDSAQLLEVLKDISKEAVRARLAVGKRI